MDNILTFWCVRTIWVHSGLFSCFTKLVAKRAELVQKFVPRCGIGIFRNQCTRSTPLYPKLTFWSVSYYLGSFGIVRLPYETRCKMGRTSAKVRETKSCRTFRNERARSTPLDNILMFWCVRTIWVHSGLFSCLTKLVAKRAEQVQKFVPRSRVGIFRNKSTRSIGLYPKLTFLSVLHYLGASGTVWLPYETRAKRAKLVQKFVPQSCLGIFRDERTRSNPLDPKPTFSCVLYLLGAFGTVWLPYKTRCKTGRTSAKVRATKSRRNFSQ